eukprot:CAMPEP_0172450198 /NCGR_PEP_ID=MMETSP1065-20121228/8647_1 /TAXON_ID=265537 /ORGANISM="Amphiprora paludosa, Strain CCMP125" /LENGTH=531 /DNA_ID=CAMNT_0013201975 /DNA_START=79 /DNA_END=1674 /DNA_ORIENTATION=+
MRSSASSSCSKGLLRSVLTGKEATPRPPVRTLFASAVSRLDSSLPFSQQQQHNGKKRPYPLAVFDQVRPSTASTRSLDWRSLSSRSKSTAAAVSTDDYHVEDRPRLAALRERLQTEPAPRPASQYAQNGSSPIVTTTTSSVTATSPSPAVVESPILDMEELRAWADAQPDLPLDNQKLLLTDRYQRHHSYLRLSLTERCNLRCTYCMPPEGVPLQPKSHILQTSELLQLASYFRYQGGVSKFRLTGGEPTLRADLVDIVRGLKALDPQQIGMTTNGIVLASKLPALVEAGMDSINISLDTLQPDKFAELTRRPAGYLDKVWQALEACQEVQQEQMRMSGQSKPNLTVKLNCVVMRNVNTDEIADFVKLTQTFPHLAIRFIEYMPFSDNGWNNDQLVPYPELLQDLHDNHNIDLQKVPSPDPSDTTKWYQTPWSSTASSRNIGFITSMSQHFCGTCNRLRLTADGQLKVCLFDGKTELSLRDALRAGFTNQQLAKVIHAAVQNKHYKLGGHVDPQALADDADTNRPMTLIGG